MRHAPLVLKPLMPDRALMLYLLEDRTMRFGHHRE